MRLYLYILVIFLGLVTPALAKAGDGSILKRINSDAYIQYSASFSSGHAIEVSSNNANSGVLIQLETARNKSLGLPASSRQSPLIATLSIDGRDFNFVVARVCRANMCHFGQHTAEDTPKIKELLDSASKVSFLVRDENNASTSSYEMSVATQESAQKLSESKSLTVEAVKTETNISPIA